MTEWRAEVGPAVRVALVVLNWNGGEDTLACLASLSGVRHPGLDVYLVDNASTDGSLEEVERRHPGVRVLRNERNLGFSEGSNVGIREGLRRGADHVGLLNNDVVVPPGFLAPLVEVLEGDPEVGVVGPKVLCHDDPGRIWAAGALVGFHWNLSRLRGHRRRDTGRYDASKDVDYVPGCALLAPRHVWESVGLLDPRYFAYMEDVEWCLRVRRAGWKVRYEPRSVVRHKASGSTGGGYSPRRKYMNAANSVRFLREHGTAKLWAAFLLLDCALWPVLFLAGLGSGRWRGAWAKLRGILDGVRGRAVLPPGEER